MKQLSSLGLTLAALQAQDPKLMSGSGASCLTGELTSDPSAKFALLISTYARVTTGDLAALPEAADLAGRVVSSLKLLLEMHGSALTAAQREAALALYSQPGWPACTAASTLDPVPDTSTCGDGSASAPDPQPGDPPAPTKAELDGVLTFCRRLSLNHVPVSGCTRLSTGFFRIA